MTTKLVKELQDEKYTLVQDDKEIRHTLWAIGYKEDQRYIGCLLVEVLDGDYGEVWAIDRFIPYLNETAYRIN